MKCGRRLYIIERAISLEEVPDKKRMVCEVSGKNIVKIINTRSVLPSKLLPEQQYKSHSKKVAFK